MEMTCVRSASCEVDSAMHKEEELAASPNSPGAPGELAEVCWGFLMRTHMPVSRRV